MVNGLDLSLGAVLLGGVVAGRNQYLSSGSQLDNLRSNIPKQFLDQIDVSHDHASAAVPSAAKLVHSVTTRG